jgi:hypothetical protein
MEFVKKCWSRNKGDDDGNDIEYHVRINGSHFCCSKQCIDFGDDCCVVDGMACTKCLAFSSCMCQCKSYMKYKYKRVLENRKKDAIRELEKIKKQYSYYGLS